jgi:CYTH domain-containing protein
MGTSAPGRYALPEYERRFLLDSVPVEASDPRVLVDRYLTGTRLRLRTVTDASTGALLERKLGHKVRADPDDPTFVWHTSLYLDDTEAALLAGLAAVEVTKTRHRWHHDGYPAAVDVINGPTGLVIAELNFPDHASLRGYEPGAPLGAEITMVPALTGPGLANAERPA